MHMHMHMDMGTCMHMSIYIGMDVRERLWGDKCSEYHPLS